MKNMSAYWEKVQRDNPLTLSVTNQVTIGDCANGLLAIGASPVMSDDAADAEALAALAAATVLNIGTVNAAQFQVMLAAGRGARNSRRPIVFDPVGAGATPTRREYSSRVITELKPEIIRGNFSEIMALSDMAGEQKGVDSAQAGDAARVATVAGALAERLGCVVAVTGATDVVAGGG
ncbi:MAG: hydroxyethylthiazole kinase, partial [Candidatus Adiutrix sp.]|nr:hydroxyethylthiazole kinase [Candidatus Adiutrix sp.]